MNKIEEIVYHALYKNPTVKIFVRNVYQDIFCMLLKPKRYNPESTQIAKGSYFGFHDVSQMSPDDSKLLALRNPFEKRMPKSGESEEIGYWDVSEDGKLGGFHCVDKTFAWNFHKGCREQWFDNEHIVYNTVVDGKVVCKKTNVDTGNSEIWKYPIDTLSNDRKEYLTFSYERLERCMAGYGYPYSDEDSYLNDEAPSETGLFIVDIASGKREMLFSLAELAKTAPTEFRKDHIHYVTHTEFSHDDRYISFLHRWIRNTGTTLKRWTRIMVYDRVNKTLTELPSQISGSHYVWNTKHQLLATCIIDNKSVQVLFDMQDVQNYRIVAADVLNSDGHQTFINDNEFITDTYPDRQRISYLYRVNIAENKATRIACLYSPLMYRSGSKHGHVSCDLHPRMSFSKKYLTYDCTDTGVRSVHLVRL